MHLQAPHCPACGAPLDVPVNVERVLCPYCAASLIVDPGRVSTQPRDRTEHVEEDKVAWPEPEATLRNWATSRFELSLVEQHIEGAVPDVFAGLELGEERFAFVSARVVNKDGRPIQWSLEEAFGALKASLENDGDPGLAANLALEALCTKPFEHRFECAIALFEPRHMRVTPYSVGAADSILWASSEEGRGITKSLRHQALERKSLRERGDHFANGEPIHLAVGDLIVFASPGFLSRGASGYFGGSRLLFETVNAHLGEAPLRIVALSKNAFWSDFQKHAKSGIGPVGDVKVVAVRPVLPDLLTTLPKLETQVLKPRRFEFAAALQPGDQLRLLPLHDDRQVAVWLSGGSEAAMNTACDAVLAVLDEKNHGDNENPRRAGREALAAIGPHRLAVIQFINQHQRVKYFRAGWRHPLALGARGGRGDNLQQFDEGGEVTIAEGGRLFFPGGLSYEGEHGSAESFATVWRGGKASRLFEALLHHWKTKKSGNALEAILKAALSDEAGADVSGFALVTGLP